MSESGFLAGALARRLAHDLAGPLAAIVTVAEMAPDTDPLMLEAIAELRARLSLFRLLFGGEPDAAFERGEALVLLRAHLAARQHGLEATLPETGRAARGLLLLALAASDMLMGAGRIMVGPEAVRAEGRCREIGVQVVAALATGRTAEPGLSPAACAAALLGPLVVTGTDTGLVFSRRHP